MAQQSSEICNNITLQVCEPCQAPGGNAEALGPAPALSAVARKNGGDRLSPLKSGYAQTFGANMAHGGRPQRLAPNRTPHAACRALPSRSTRSLRAVSREMKSSRSRCPCRRPAAFAVALECGHKLYARRTPPFQFRQRCRRHRSLPTSASAQHRDTSHKECYSHQNSSNVATH